MIATEEYKEDLIKIAKKLERSSQSYPKDEEGPEKALSMIRLERENIPGAI